MKAEKAVERAEHALRTNQPNLATIYMAEALRDLEARDRKRRPLHYFFKDMGAAMVGVGEALGLFADAMVEAFKPVSDLMAQKEMGHLDEIEVAAFRAQSAREQGNIYGPEYFRLP